MEALQNDPVPQTRTTELRRLRICQTQDQNLLDETLEKRRQWFGEQWYEGEVPVVKVSSVQEPGPVDAKYSKKHPENFLPRPTWLVRPWHTDEEAQGMWVRRKKGGAGADSGGAGGEKGENAEGGRAETEGGAGGEQRGRGEGSGVVGAV